MTSSGLLIASVLSAALLGAGCDRTETPVGNAVEKTKDALDMREHEKLKDAAESTGAAIEEAAEGVREEAIGK